MDTCAWRKGEAERDAAPGEERIAMSEDGMYVICTKKSHLVNFDGRLSWVVQSGFEMGRGRTLSRDTAPSSVLHLWKALATRINLALRSILVSQTKEGWDS
jgi:hypothetical protein